jgi:glutathione S-transferase
MIANGGGYYLSPYGSASFPIPNNYGLGPPTISPFYNPTYQQQQQQKSSVHPINGSTSSFKLYDLDLHGQSEILRLIFAYAGVSYKDKRLKKEEWEKIKTQMSFDQLPILRVNNQYKIFHLHAIIRYLAREFQLYGVGKHDHAIVDIIVESIRPLQDKIFEQLINSTDQEQTFKQFIIDHGEIYLKQFEKFFEMFNRHGPFYLGSHISLADLIVYDTINYLIQFDTNLLDNYSHLKEAHRRLEKHPKLLNYLNKKPNNQNKISPQLDDRHRTKSPTPNIPVHHHHHRHRSHDEHHSNHHHHRHHHHHHHRRTHSKEPTPFSQTKRSSKSPSISKKDKASTDIIPPPPPITTSTTTTEPTVD